MITDHNKDRNQANTKPSQKEQERDGNRDPQRHMNFFFESVYQIVTWVLIALAITSLSLCITSANWRGVLWSSVALLCLVIVMLALLAQKHYAIFQPKALTDHASEQSPPAPSVQPPVLAAVTPPPVPEQLPPKSKPKPTMRAEVDPRTIPASGASGSGAPPYVNTYRHPTFKWTDYTEDYFYGAVWRWEYRPEMGEAGKEPRNLKGYCPDCRKEIKPQYVQYKDDGTLESAIFLCDDHPLKQYKIEGHGIDPYGRVRLSIQRKLASGQWEDVVRRQMDVRYGRI